MEPMSAHDAVHALRSLEGLEKRLGQQLGGITIMLWGIVSAAIFLAYGLVAPLVAQTEAVVALAVLWLPFVLAGGVVTQRLWKQHALSFGKGDTSVRDTVLITVALMVLGGVFWLATRPAGVDWGATAIMTSTNGLVAAGMGVFGRRHGMVGWSHLVGAGTAMVLGGTLLGVWAPEHGVASLAGAAIAGASWFLAGYAIHQQG